MNECETILEMGGEGGSITLYGIRTDAGWLFSREVIDQTPELIDEDAIEHRSEVVNSWPAALNLMSSYPWRRLFPVKLHPEFKELIFAAVNSPSKGEEAVSEYEFERWKRKCGVSGAC